MDNEPTVRILVTEVLEDLGYTAIEASDGPAGLKVLRSNVRIELLVTDVGLPGGMNGRQVADAARVGRPSLKVLYITGYAENAVVGNGHPAGTTRNLSVTKPGPARSRFNCWHHPITTAEIDPTRTLNNAFAALQTCRSSPWQTIDRGRHAVHGLAPYEL
ncbi:response regulator [Methylobacterium sp. 88A]|uniref:response regulator n=1 Tax=Methylobacterium sp. 88A TaxID=1131813 RepID=UPI002473C0D0|nr:response regulator [Methylobacterium sp. 88A]